MNGSDDHRVCHRALSSLEALRLGRGKLDPQCALVVEQVEIHDSHGRVRELSDVTPEEERLAGFESLQWPMGRGSWSAKNQVSRGSEPGHRTYSDHGLLHPLSCRVHVRDIPPAPHISELLDRVQLAVLVPRVVDQRDAQGGRELL